MTACHKRTYYPQTTPSSKPATKKTLSKVEFPKREFRATWIATVDNIDWPSKKGLSADAQQQEFKKLLDYHQKIGINAVMVQVRAAADAFYSKSNEPWSEWLTGEQGKAPQPYYEPMRFMISEAHQRNMEFHAWLNMNRGVHKSAKSIAKNHITNTKPEWFLTYGGEKIFNLGIPEVREYIVNIVINIVKNYDVDGIHFDDYFYPYTITGQKLEDDETFKKYNFTNFVKIEDWRRNNVDLVIETISKAIKAEKPRMKFGISPLGVWRNKSIDPTGSDTQGGQTSYDNLYADSRKWVKNGWVDYIAPQLYFAFEHPKVPYKPLADWWRKNTYNKHLYIGQAAYKVDTKSKENAWLNPSQIPNQVRYNRAAKEVQGMIFFSSKSLINNQLGISDSLRQLCKTPALLPAMAWKDNIAPNAPKNVNVQKNNSTQAIVSWKMPDEASDKEPVYFFVIYRFDENEQTNIENPANILQIVRNDGNLSFVDKTIQEGKNYRYVITALDRLQNESLPSQEVYFRY